MIYDMQISEHFVTNLTEFVEDYPEVFILLLDTTIDTLQNIDYVFSKYPTPTLVNALNKSPVLTLEDHQPIYVTEGLCGNIQRAIKTKKIEDDQVIPMRVLTSRFNRYLRFRIFDNKPYPISVPATDFSLKIREDIQNNQMIEDHAAGELMSPEIISAVKQYTWHHVLAQYNGYELAMYDPRSPYGRARLKFVKDCVPELIKIRDFLKEYLRQPTETPTSETPLSETVFFIAQQTEAQPWTKSTSRTHQV